MVIFAFDGGYVSKFLRNKIFLYLAKISYSVYMVHAIITLVFYMVGTKLFPKHIFYPEIVDGVAIGGGLAGDLYVLIYLAVTIFVSHFTYKFVEVPGGKFLRNFSFRKKAPKTA
jgi:peptidoglycan/LPS O-acetylase OafA/YrhL